MVNLIVDVEEMTCTRCNKTLPATEENFYKQKYSDNDKNVYYKLSHPCKPCRREIARERTSDPEYRAKQKLYHAKWTRQNRDREAESKRKLREKNPEHYKNYFKNYQQNNMNQFVMYARERKEKDMNFKLTKNEWLTCKEYFNCSCAYCGMSEEEHKQIHKTQLHKEHVIVMGRNNLTNCVPACKECNGLKNTFELNEWYNPDNPAYSKRRYNRIIKWLLSFTKKD